MSDRARGDARAWQGPPAETLARLVDQLAAWARTGETAEINDALTQVDAELLCADLPRLWRVVARAGFVGARGNNTPWETGAEPILASLLSPSACPSTWEHQPAEDLDASRRRRWLWSARARLRVELRELAEPDRAPAQIVTRPPYLGIREASGSVRLSNRVRALIAGGALGLIAAMIFGTYLDGAGHPDSWSSLIGSLLGIAGAGVAAWVAAWRVVVHDERAQGERIRTTLEWLRWFEEPQRSAQRLATVTRLATEFEESWVSALLSQDDSWSIDDEAASERFSKLRRQFPRVDAKDVTNVRGVKRFMKKASRRSSELARTSDAVVRATRNSFEDFCQAVRMGVVVEEVAWRSVRDIVRLLAARGSPANDHTFVDLNETARAWDNELSSRQAFATAVQEAWYSNWVVVLAVTAVGVVLFATILKILLSALGTG